MSRTCFPTAVRECLIEYDFRSLFSGAPLRGKQYACVTSIRGMNKSNGIYFVKIYSQLNEEKTHTLFFLVSSLLQNISWGSAMFRSAVFSTFQSAAVSKRMSGRSYDILKYSLFCLMLFAAGSLAPISEKSAHFKSASRHAFIFSATIPVNRGCRQITRMFRSNLRSFRLGRRGGEKRRDAGNSIAATERQ